jgi:hypothetical protein
LPLPVNFDSYVPKGEHTLGTLQKNEGVNRGSSPLRIHFTPVG